MLGPKDSVLGELDGPLPATRSTAKWEQLARHVPNRGRALEAARSATAELAADQDAARTARHPVLLILASFVLLLVPAAFGAIFPGVPSVYAGGIEDVSNRRARFGWLKLRQSVLVDNY
jgi:hypothetical protein